MVSSPTCFAPPAETTAEPGAGNADTGLSGPAVSTDAASDATREDTDGTGWDALRPGVEHDAANSIIAAITILDVKRATQPPLPDVSGTREAPRTRICPD